MEKAWGTKRIGIQISATKKDEEKKLFLFLSCVFSLSLAFLLDYLHVFSFLIEDKYWFLPPFLLCALSTTHDEKQKVNENENNKNVKNKNVKTRGFCCEKVKIIWTYSSKVRLYRMGNEHWFICWRVPGIHALADPHHPNAMQMRRPLANDLDPRAPPRPFPLPSLSVSSDLLPFPTPRSWGRDPQRDGVCHKSPEGPVPVVMDMIWGTRKSLSCYITW